MSFAKLNRIFCQLLCLTGIINGLSFTNLPLIFDSVKENPFKTRVFINPAASVRLIKELSRRDVVYIQDNDTLAIEEKLGEWTTLLSNEPTPSIRYLQLKSALCEEKDYRISWIDQAGGEHDSVVQRLAATPQEWNPEVKIRVSGVVYEEPVVAMSVEWTLEGDETTLTGVAGEEFEQLTNPEPVIELLRPFLSCETLFTSRVALPVVSIPKKTIFFHSDYVDHVCTFALRLRVSAYDSKRHCKANLQTSNEKSLNITLRCDKILNYKCSSVDYVDKCRATCDVEIDSIAEYRPLNGGRGTKPVVKVQWHPLNAPHRAKAVETLLRLTSMEAMYNNYPLSQSQYTVLVLNSTSYDLTPFSQSLESFLGVQVCVFFQLCESDLKWQLVPNHAVFVSRLLGELPPPEKLLKRVSNKPPIKITRPVTSTASSTTTTSADSLSVTEDDITTDEFAVTVEASRRL